MAGEALNRPIPTVVSDSANGRAHRRSIATALNRNSQFTIRDSRFAQAIDLAHSSPPTIITVADNGNPQSVTNWQTLETMAFTIPDTFLGLWQFEAVVHWETTASGSPFWLALDAPSQHYMAVNPASALANNSMAMGHVRNSVLISSSVDGTITLKGAIANGGSGTVTVRRIHLYGNRISDINAVTQATA